MTLRLGIRETGFAVCVRPSHLDAGGRGKVVVVQQRGIAHPENGEPYTFKLYASEKMPTKDGHWQHERTTLNPDLDRPGFTPIEIQMHEG